MPDSNIKVRRISLFLKEMENSLKVSALSIFMFKTVSIYMSQNFIHKIKKEQLYFPISFLLLETKWNQIKSENPKKIVLSISNFQVIS